MKSIIVILLAISMSALSVRGGETPDSVAVITSEFTEDTAVETPDENTVIAAAEFHDSDMENASIPDSVSVFAARPVFTYVPGDRINSKGKKQIETIYAYPEGNSLSFQYPDWHRMWINTAVLTGAFVSSLVVLECLPEDATAWNRAELQNTPFYKRWYDHVFKDGFEWDSDNPVFNLVLHPYAGAVYFMAARSCGFSFWGSLLYCTCISNIGWELGIEACNELPSIQDLFITPLVGSAIGEGFYRLKRYIVDHDYRLFGSPVIGNIVAFLIDPVNEVVGLFAGNPARRYAKERRLQISSTPVITGKTVGFSLNIEF